MRKSEVNRTMLNDNKCLMVITDFIEATSYLDFDEVNEANFSMKITAR
jgi:hypothetical protein